MSELDNNFVRISNYEKISPSETLVGLSDIRTFNWSFDVRIGISNVLIFLIRHMRGYFIARTWITKEKAVVERFSVNSLIF